MFSSYWTDIVFTLELLLGTEKLKKSNLSFLLVMAAGGRGKIYVDKCK